VGGMVPSLVIIKNLVIILEDKANYKVNYLFKESHAVNNLNIGKAKPSYSCGFINTFFPLTLPSYSKSSAF
jgi:hypothetical protein